MHWIHFMVFVLQIILSFFRNISSNVFIFQWIAWLCIADVFACYICIQGASCLVCDVKGIGCLIAVVN